jgi:hypothetical protein
MRLVIETRRADIYEYAKKNLTALIRGHLPQSEFQLKSVSNRKDVYKRRDEFDCLVYYRCASMARRIKKIPFFVYWLILKQQGLFTRANFNDAFNRELRPQASWIKDAEKIIVRLSEDSELKQEIREKVEKWKW